MEKIGKKTRLLIQDLIDAVNNAYWTHDGEPTLTQPTIHMQMAIENLRIALNAPKRKAKGK